MLQRLNTGSDADIMRVVLLTSSGKNGAACVAGYDLQTKQFVRFVSNAESAAGIPFEEIRGLSAFDVVEAESPQRCPIGPQTENVYVKPFGLRRIGRYTGTIEDIRKEIRYPDQRSLAQSVKNKLFNLFGYRHSLEIVCVHDLVLKRTVKSGGGITTRADFSYRDKRHTDYRVTDFSYDLRYQKENELRFPCADLVLSIPKEDYIKDGYSLGYFKFVAAIFPIQKPEEESEGGAMKSAVSEREAARQPCPPKNKNNAYEPWTREEENRLLSEFSAGTSLSDIAAAHDRSRGAIEARLKKLGRLA